MTDPTTILREAIKAVVIESEADDILATRIPQACQTCKGTGRSLCTGAQWCEHCPTCPDCPTILTLLLWGWNVAKATTRFVVDPSYDFHTEDEWVTVPSHPEHELAGDLLRALREVPT